MYYWWMSMWGVGAALALWAHFSLPPGTVDFPVRIQTYRTRRGPYRWLRHPMYVGNVMLVTGMAGLGGGAWGAVSMFFLAELVHREWAWREDKDA